MAAGLDWLDRRFGEAHSAQALGVCTAIALCYAWSSFHLGYGMGAPGRLGELELLPAAAEPIERWTLVALAVPMPMIAYLFGRWLGGLADRAERRLKARLIKTWCRQSTSSNRGRFHRIYRFVSTLAFLGIVSPLLFVGVAAGEGQPLFNFTLVVGFGMLFAAGPIFGLLMARRTKHSWLKGPTAAVASASAIAGTGAVARAIGAVSATRWAEQDRRGAFAGGVGMLLFFGLGGSAFSGDVDDAAFVLIIMFFLLLPLANGLWD